MELKLFIKALFIKLKGKAKLNKGLTKSYVSLFLAVVLGVGCVTSWITASTTAEASYKGLSMRGAQGMRNNKNQRNRDEIVIPSFTLEEASSVDGRNIYFPSSMFDNPSDEQTATGVRTVPNGDGTQNITYEKNIDSVTSKLVFREASVGDKNVRYAYAEAPLAASSDGTKVWIRGYKVEVGNEVFEDNLVVDNSGNASNNSNILDMQKVPQSCPIRIAIVSDSGDDARIFDPSAMIEDYAENTNAVYHISSDGNPSKKRTKLESFSNYYYGTGNPLFQLDAGETKDISVIAWLEGTHERAFDYIGKQVSIEITIETNVTDMGFVYFHDWTSGDQQGTNVTKSNYRTYANYGDGHWLANDNAVIVMSYKDTTVTPNVQKTAVMTKLPRGQTSDDGRVTAVDDYTYYAAIPFEVVTDISFYRLAPLEDYWDYPRYILKGNIYNSWHTRSTFNLSTDASSWLTAFGLGSMLTSRVKDGETYWHYFAIRGNGYGLVDKTASDKYLKWLSPCIGFWGSNTGSLYGSSGSVTYN